MRIAKVCAGLFLMVWIQSAFHAQSLPDVPVPADLYQQMRTFRLSSRAIKVQNLKLQRDKLEMTFAGVFYLAEPVDGGVYGAFFSGQGQLRSEPVNPFEQDSVRRFLKEPVVQATFTTAALRFSDTTYQELSAVRATESVPPLEVQDAASKLDSRLLKETGLNISSRILSAVLNNDNPGVFFAEFDGGNRGRFSALIDHQTRSLSSVFGINGGEKGLLFKYRDARYGNDIWTAFYDDQDYARGSTSFGDSFNLISIPTYRMDVDVRNPADYVRLQADLEINALSDNVRVIPMQLNEGLSELDNERRTKGMRVTGAQTREGTALPVIQDEWETGFSIILPEPLRKGQSAAIVLKLEGKDPLLDWRINFHYPRSTTTWYPRYGYLTRSQFDMTFHHDKRDRIASIGQRAREGAAPDGTDEWITEWKTNEPVALVTFVCGRFQRHEQVADLDGRSTPVEYYSLPSDVLAIDEKFILAEMGNAARYFRNVFGPYPYGRLGGAFFPGNFGQGFPTLLLLPITGTGMAVESPTNISFAAHEMAHQWWGNIVGWRSYRDQWLSEGFAEYSGTLYTGLRLKPKDSEMLIRRMRETLELPVVTDRGLGNQKLYEIGPLVLGGRLESRLSGGANKLIYSKGALVLRMLHYLLSDPSNGDDKEFFSMLKDFVERNRNGWATSESFMQVASEHFARSPLGRQYGIRNLDWFLSQWIYQTAMPDYHLDYHIESKPGGGVVLKGTLLQQNVPEDWVMLLPVVAQFSGSRSGTVTIHALGPRTPVEIALPEKPRSVQLDPNLWILSGKTDEKGN